MATTTSTETKSSAGTVRVGDRVFSATALSASLTIMLALAGVFIFLAAKGFPGMSQPAQYYKGRGDFLNYVGPLLFGTVLAAIIALLIAVPLAMGIALMVSHYAPRRLAAPVGYIIDLLAAIPSVVYGLWGIWVLAPQLRTIHEWLYDKLSFIPLFEGPPSSTGRTMLTAGVVLAIMILPIITAISREVFSQTPRLHEEAALALGATRWEMIKLAVFPYSRSGMIAAVMLGLGRALGETMAVAMVLSPDIGYIFNIISSRNAATIPSNIAQNYKEGTPAGVSVLIATGLVLFLVTFLVNFAARYVASMQDRRLAR